MRSVRALDVILDQLTSTETVNRTIGAHTTPYCIRTATCKPSQNMNIDNLGWLVAPGPPFRPIYESHTFFKQDYRQIYRSIACILIINPSLPIGTTNIVNILLITLQRI